MSLPLCIALDALAFEFHGKASWTTGCLHVIHSVHMRCNSQLWSKGADNTLHNRANYSFSGCSGM